MSGHVFVVHGDLTKLHADAHAISGDPQSFPSAIWCDHVDPLSTATSPVKLTDGRVVGRFRWQEREGGPWVVPVAGGKNTPFEWYAEAIRAFTKVAGDVARADGPARKKRARPLLALPNLGSKGGGQAGVIGEHLTRMLTLLGDLAHEHDVDFAFVFQERAAYEAVQVHRLRVDDPRAWSVLTEEQRRGAEALGAQAVRGELALFLGAGVSKSADLPDWSELLAELEDELLPSKPSDVHALSPLDRALLLERSAREDLRKLVAARVKAAWQHGLSHALLAALPVKEVVTTNYDALFELAVEGQGGRVHVVPYDGAASGRWMMKLHGCATKNVDDIVLTRPSFSGFDGTRGALAGLLGGILLTRHVLFVGTSLADANVLRIVDAVQRAVGDPQKELGTNLAIEEKTAAARRELWRGVLRWESFETPRALEIFLDRIAAEACTGMSFLLKPGFGVSGEGMDDVKAAIQALSRARGAIQTDAVRVLVDDFLAHFGTA